MSSDHFPDPPSPVIAPSNAMVRPARYQQAATACTDDDDIIMIDTDHHSADINPIIPTSRRLIHRSPTPDLPALLSPRLRPLDQAPKPPKNKRQHSPPTATHRKRPARTEPLFLPDQDSDIEITGGAPGSSRQPPPEHITDLTHLASDDDDDPPLRAVTTEERKAARSQALYLAPEEERCDLCGCSYRVSGVRGRGAGSRVLTPQVRGNLAFVLLGGQKAGVQSQPLAHIRAIHKDLESWKDVAEFVGAGAEEAERVAKAAAGIMKDIPVGMARGDFY